MLLSMLRRLLLTAVFGLAGLTCAYGQANDYTLTPNLSLKKPKLGSTNFGLYVNQDFDTIDSAVGAVNGTYVDLPYGSVLTYNLAQGNTFVTVLNGNVSSTSVAGTPINGQFLYIIVCQNAVGNNTYPFPAGFAIPLPPITIVPNGCTGTTWRFTSTGQWVNVGGSSSGPPGCTPSGTDNTYQKIFASGCAGAITSDNGVTATVAGALTVTGNTTLQGTLNSPGTAGQSLINNGGVVAATPCTSLPNSSSGPINQDCDIHWKGPNPWIDVSRYARIPPTGAPSTSSVTANCISGSASVVLSGSGSTLFQVSDGIALAGCGSAHSMATPTLTSVTPSGVRTFSGVNDTVPIAAAATTYNYKIYAVNSTGGYTASSATVSTTTGAATLGSTTINLTSASRANNVDSFITSSAHTLVVGMKVVLIGQSDATFNGECQVATTADNTHFTCNRGIDTRNGTTSTAATGGTVTYFIGNKLAWSVPGSPNGEYQYVVCTDRATPGTFNALGMALPLSSPTSALSDSSLSFEDYGSTISGGMTSQIPWYLPTSPCPSSAGNNILATTVAAVAGSTVTLNAAPSATLTSTARIDATPGILAAAAASTAGPRPALHFPLAPSGAALVINSPLDFRTVSAWTGLIDSPGGFTVNAPVIFPTDHVTVKGTVTLAGQSQDSFQLESLPTITVNCFACLFFTGGTSLSIQGNRFVGSGTNGALPVLINGGFGQTIQHNIFSTGGTNSDLSGIAIWLRGRNTEGITKTIFTNNLITSGPANGFDTSSATPNFICTACSSFHAADDFWVHRGALWRAIATPHQINIDGGHYINGGNQPLFNITGDNTTPGNTGVTVTVEHVQMDTIPHAVLNYLPGAGTASVIALLRDPGTPASALSIVTGAPFTKIIGQGISPFAELGQNFNVVNLTNASFSDSAVRVNGAGVMGYALATPAAPSCVISAGGNVPVLSWTYNIYALDANGNFSDVSPSITCVTTSGQQTVTITPPAQPSGSVTYRAARGGQLVNVAATRWTANVVDTFSFTAGNPGNPTGLQAGINSSNVQAPQIVLTGGGFKDVGSGTFTADRTTTWPDASGTVLLNSGTSCTNGEIALSAGWQSTGSATPTAVAGVGQTCSWTITTGTTTAANPTVTDTLTTPLQSALIVCELNIHGGTHTAVAGESFQQTTLSATAPVFTANFTPTAGGTTYFITRRCGP